MGEKMICAHCTEEIDDRQLSCSFCGEPPLLHGDYRLVEVVGSGAAGTTFRAVRESDEKVVAIKELLFHRLDSFKTQELFEREARTLEQLDHRAIPAYVDSFVIESGRSTSLYLVQEFIEGTSLQEEFDLRRYDEGEALDILSELVEITAYLHGLQPPVVHRDIKPSNIMRRASDGRLVIIDFGSVRDVVAEPTAGNATIAGTYGFMAPEQFQGRATAASDVYGLGATVVNLISRVSPAEMLGADGRPEWQKHAQTSTGFGALLEEMLSFDPRARPTSREIAGRIERLKRPAVPVARSVGAEPVVEQQPASTKPQKTYLPIFLGIGVSVVGLMMTAGFFLVSAPALDPPSVQDWAVPIADDPGESWTPSVKREISTPSVEEVWARVREEEKAEEVGEAREVEEELPSVAARAPSRIGSLRLGMSLEEAREVVPDERNWTRRGRGRPMPEGETYLVEIELAGESAECSSLFSEEEGLSSIHCVLRREFERAEHGRIRDELVAGFQEEYGSHTRYAYTDGNQTAFWWWTHPEAALVVRAEMSPLEDMRGPTGHSIKRLSLESAYYQQWHD